MSVTRAQLRERVHTELGAYLAAARAYRYVLFCTNHNRQLSPVVDAIADVDTTPNCGSCGDDRYFIAIQFLPRAEA